MVLEVGLGGRYDATNAIEKPLVTAITNIDYDHTEILGKTLKKIGTDKAGIIKSRSVFFTTERRPALLKIFNEICREKRVLFYRVSSLSSGDYQEENKALAGAISRYVGVSDAHITEGIRNARLMCRFEIIQNEKGKPLVILDGAHNRSKIKTTIDNLKKLKFKKLYLIVGISDNKDHISILKQLIPQADHVFFTRFQIKDRKCAHPKDLLAKSRKYLKKSAKTEICLDPESALLRARSKASTQSGAKDVILVAGSFFLAGELRKKWISEEWVLEHRRAFV